MDAKQIEQWVDLEKTKRQARAVILRPAAFYRNLPLTGGFQEPLIFLAVLSLVAGLVSGALLLLQGRIGPALGTVLLTPVMSAVFGFVGAAILYGIWRLMGSEKNYETAYRCLAYTAAIAPLTTLLRIIPYLGGALASAWILFLLFTASVEIHSLPRKKALTVWGALFLLLAAAGLHSEAAARRLNRKITTFVGPQGELTPEQAGKAMGEFLKGLEKAAQQK